MVYHIISECSKLHKRNIRIEMTRKEKLLLGVVQELKFDLVIK